MSKEELEKQKVDGKVEDEGNSVWFKIVSCLITIVISFVVMVYSCVFMFSGHDNFEYTESGIGYAEEFGYDGEVGDIDDYLLEDVYIKYLSKDLTPKQMELYEGYLELRDIGNLDSKEATRSSYLYKPKVIRGALFYWIIRFIVFTIAAAFLVGSCGVLFSDEDC